MYIYVYILLYTYIYIYIVMYQANLDEVQQRKVFAGRPGGGAVQSPP